MPTKKSVLWYLSMVVSLLVAFVSIALLFTGCSLLFLFLYQRGLAGAQATLDRASFI